MSVITITKDNFKQEVLESREPVLLDFWAAWCDPCQRLGPVIEQIAEEYEDQDVIVGKVDVDQEPELAQRFGVMNIPTVVFLKNGQELDRKVGAMPIDEYTQFLDDNL